MSNSEIQFLKEKGYMISPKLIQIEITTKCPLKCPQCYKNNENSGVDMDFVILKDILKKAADIGVKYIMLNGGEPAIYYKFPELLEELSKYKFDVTCVFSGYGIDKKFIQNIKNKVKFNFDILISLNGSNKEIHEYSRQGYNLAIDAIHLLSENNINFGVNWVARNDNVRDFKNVIELSQYLNVSFITVAATKLDGSGVLPSALSESDYKMLANDITSINERKGFNYVKVQYCFPLLNKLLNKYVNKNLNRCSAGYRSCYILVDGLYAPCSHMPHLSEKFESIYQYWTSSKYLLKIRNAKIQNEHCIKNCKEYKQCMTCFCMTEYNMQFLSYGIDNCPIENIINFK